MKNALVFLVLSFSIYSCVDDILVDIPDSDRKLVVDAWIRTDTLLNTIKLSQTTNFSEDTVGNLLGGAIVYIESIGGTIRKDFTEQKLGIYQAIGDDWFLDDSTYVLHVNVNGKRYQSTPQHINSVPDIDSMFFLSGDIINNFGLPITVDGGFYTAIQAIEKPGRGDNYAWKLFINGEDKSIRNNLTYLQDADLVDGGPIEPPFSILLDSVVIGDTVQVEQMTITDEGFRYLFELQAQFNGGSPFSSPPAPVKSNMFNPEDKEELVLGVFMASSSFRRTLIVREELIIQ